jgi:hypothetical protein
VLPLKVVSAIATPILFVLSGTTLHRITEAYLDDTSGLASPIMTLVNLIGYFDITSFRSQSLYIQSHFFEVWTSCHFWYLRVGSVIVVQFWTLVRVLKDNAGRSVSFFSRPSLSARVIQHPAHCVCAFSNYVTDPQHFSSVPWQLFYLISIVLDVVSGSRCTTTGTLSC